jgi:hypothetical protein
LGKEAGPQRIGANIQRLNNTDREVVLLVGGEAPKRGNRIFYPINPTRSGNGPFLVRLS